MQEMATLICLNTQSAALELKGELEAAGVTCSISPLADKPNLVGTEIKVLKVQLVEAQQKLAALPCQASKPEADYRSRISAGKAVVVAGGVVLIAEVLIRLSA
jgi:hypothetical protein